MDFIKNKLGIKILEGQYDTAIKIIHDPVKFVNLIDKLDKKLIDYPIEGEQLVDLIGLIDLAKCYAKGTYTDIQEVYLAIIIATLNYWVSNVDLIPDLVPIIGLWDDEAVLNQGLQLAQEDIQKFKKWRKTHQK